MAFYLTDDGTMDTVVKCENCGQELRYNYDGETGDSEIEANYDVFVSWALDDADFEHGDCEKEGSELL
jgi:hypothetical protein